LGDVALSLINKLQKCKLEDNQVAFVWLGQAGFLIKSQNEKLIAIDPYLSHCGERLKNFIRMSPSLVNAEEFDVDLYFVTHKHFDHFDYDAIPIIAKNTKADFFGPVSCVEELEKIKGINKKMELLKVGLPFIHIDEEISVKAVYSDHGDLEENAIGLLINVSGMRFYVTGDTAYRPDQMKEIKGINPDVMIASINGEFGNLDPVTGAELSKYVKAKVIIPCHFWTFMEHKGRPDLIIDSLEKVGSEAVPYFLTPGDIYICKKEKDNVIIYRKEI
jgi:L-ascorbate 6-phosphate lactonase